MFTRLVHSGAVLGIASGLVFLPVVTAAADGALNLVQEVAQTGLKLVASDGVLTEGAVTATIPEATLACVGPQVAVCATVGIAVAGAVLYATKDTWMPWVRTAFGDGGPASGGVPGPVALSWSGPSTGDATQIGLVMQGPTSLEAEVYVAYQYVCTTSGGIDLPVSVPATHLWYFQGWKDPVKVMPLQGCGPGSLLKGIDLQGWRGQDNVTYNSLHWGQPFNPATNSTVNTSVDCVKPDGTTGTVSVQTINPDGGVLVPSCVAAFGPGSHGTKIALNGGQTGQPQLPMSTITVPTTSTLYPNCVGGGVGCTYVVKYRGNPCVIGQVECVNWALRAQVDGNTDYTCAYGPYMIPLAGCALDERAYEDSPHRLSKLNTDGNPMTWDGPRPSWATDPALNGDPNGLPLPGAVPIAPPAGAPGGAPAQVPTTGDMPAPDPASPHGAPNESTDCWPSGGAGWNPAEWVLRPIKCALTWAFVPSSLFMNGWSDGIKGEWSSSPFGQWLAPLSGFGTLHIASGGCEGPALPTGFLGEGLSNGSFHVASPAVLPAVLHPFSACADPMAGVARTSNMILTAGIAFYGGMKVVRQLGYAFGFQIHVGSERSTFT